MPNKKYLKQRIIDLHEVLAKHRLDGYIIPSTDEFFNEYVPHHLNRLQYITGFSCSNGVAIITKHKQIFLTDSRYTLQASRELEGFEVHDMYQDDLSDIYKAVLGQGAKIGFDPSLMTQAELKQYERYAKSGELIATEQNIIDELWERELPAPSAVRYLELSDSGRSVEDKIKDVTSKLGCDAYLVTDPIAVCWLLNIRGQDIPYNQIILSKAIVSKEGRVELFTHSDVQESENIIVYKLSDYNKRLQAYKNITADSAKISVLDARMMGEHFVSGQDIIDPIKAVKNKVELRNFEDAHVKDGVALTKALFELFNADQLPTEYEFGLSLRKFRGSELGFVDESFPPIVGYAANGAIIHYRAEHETCRNIERDSLLLIDSGGHYNAATTDVTRTVHLGEPTDEHKRCFTLVLKGMIQLSMATFPSGTNGMALDVLARSALWKEGLNYGHGTSHGVGAMLSVHESPPRIGQGYAANNRLQEGMVLSNEPGFYKEGEFGIRVENVMYVKKSKYQGYLCFETLTLVPIQMNLVDKSLLERKELEWLLVYNARVCEVLKPHLTDEEVNWLKLYI